MACRRWRSALDRGHEKSGGGPGRGNRMGRTPGPPNLFGARSGNRGPCAEIREVFAAGPGWGPVQRRTPPSGNRIYLLPGVLRTRSAAQEGASPAPPAPPPRFSPRRMSLSPVGRGRPRRGRILPGKMRRTPGACPPSVQAKPALAIQRVDFPARLTRGTAIVGTVGETRENIDAVPRAGFALLRSPGRRGPAPRPGGVCGDEMSALEGPRVRPWSQM